MNYWIYSRNLHYGRIYVETLNGSRAVWTDRDVIVQLSYWNEKGETFFAEAIP